MGKKSIWIIFGVIIISGFISHAVSLPIENLTDISSGTDTREKSQYECNQPYALCDTAICVPSQTDPERVICSCFLVNGVSMGGKECSELAPVGMYVTGDGEWMIKAGYSVGQITSTYSFYNAAPTEEGAIDPNTIPTDYSGDIYLKPCQNGNWADCWNQPCTVLPEDITADINQDRKAAPYATCECGLVMNSSDWYIGVNGEEKCRNTTFCNDFIISGANTNTMKPGIMVLKKYLQDNPGIDPSQPYAMGICEDCKDCVANSS